MVAPPRDICLISLAFVVVDGFDAMGCDEDEDSMIDRISRRAPRGKMMELLLDDDRPSIVAANNSVTSTDKTIIFDGRT